MTDADIIKVLEICLNKSGGCISAKCPLVNDLHCKELLISRCFEIINRQQAEIERLKSIEPTEEVRVKCEEVISKIRAEAVREFAEKLKREKFCRLTEYDEGGWAAERLAVKVDDIDNLVKEFAKDINVRTNPEQLKGEENG